MTQLGGMGIILGAFILIKLIMQCVGVDANADDEPTNQSYFRLHEAF